MGGSDGAVHPLCNFFVREILGISQTDDFAVVVGQTFKDFGQQEFLLVLDDFVAVFKSCREIVVSDSAC